MFKVTRATVTKARNSNGPVGNSKTCSKSGKNNGEGRRNGDQEAGTKAKGSSSQDSTNAHSGNTQHTEGNKKLQLDKILKHWFLLDYDLVAAINKGNHSLIPMAEARVNYLTGLVPDKLLAEGIKGKEEALWSIHELLYNNGCWEKASNLVVADYDGSKNGNSTDPVQPFLNAYAHLIHPNTRVGALKGNREAVRMALNQIHYGSIEAARQSSKTGVTRVSEEEKAQSGKVKAKSGISGDVHSITCKFLEAYESLIEPSVLRDAIAGNDKAISLALGQVHHHTLSRGEKMDVKSSKQDETHYKEALLSRPASVVLSSGSARKSHVSSPAHKSGNATVFFTGIDRSLHLKDLWMLFKKEGKIKDIILPRKKDKNGNNYGFIILVNAQEANRVIKAFSGMLIGSKHLYLAVAKTKPRFQASLKAHSNFVNLEAKKGQEELPKEREGSTDIPIPSPKVTPPSTRFVASETKENQSRQDHSEHPNLLPSEEFTQVMQQSLLLRTVKNETVQSVAMMVEGLGAYNARIRGITGSSFLAYFPFELDFLNIDREFLQIGFDEVRDVKVEDLIPSRKAWVEIRGLPIPGWTEHNFKEILKDYGTILHSCKTRDEEEFYVSPKFLIETHVLDKIKEFKSIKLMKKVWKLRVQETLEEGSLLHDTVSNPDSSYSQDDEDKSSPQPPLSMPDNCQSPVHSNDSEHDGTSKQSNSQLSGVASSIEEEEVSSTMNPMTPRSYHQSGSDNQNSPKSLSDQISTKSDSPIILNTDNWKPREPVSSLSNIKGASDDGISSLGEGPLDDHDNHSDSDLTILGNLAKLKVKSARGRPRKFNPKVTNKFFKVPRRKKTRSEGLQQITHYFLNNSHDEAESIYESGVLMGLLPIHSKAQSLELIKENLAA
ncbi:hypothetical protein DCAR_0313466 [Daucus carota subsp. sativus]|uniref:RRM domain-containing protein n=1 Tax=Daucus carota subsp. sativus TaxID=79200 RepID=A0A161WWT1_DAUCS|nr:hypothetical protein DCAR_0313466 [Daucus carota subsp. sativus]